MPVRASLSSAWSPALSSECISDNLNEGINECPICQVKINMKSVVRNASYATMLQCVAKIKAIILDDPDYAEKERRELEDEAFMDAFEGFLDEEDEMLGEEVETQLHNLDTELESLASQTELKPSASETEFESLASETELESLVSETEYESPASETEFESLVSESDEDLMPQVVIHTQESSPLPAKKRSDNYSKSTNAKKAKTREKKYTRIGLLLTGLSEDQRAVIQKSLPFLSLLTDGAKVTIERDYSPTAVTHILCACAPHGRCPRTLKYLMGIAGKSWIVSINWLLDSLSANEIMDEEEFVVIGDEAVQCDTFACEKSRNSSTGLFAAKEFYLAGSFNGAGPSKNDLSQLIKLSGGKVVSKANSATFCVSNNASGPKSGERHFTWLFDCISHYQIQQ